MYEHQCQLFVKPFETIRNQIKSASSANFSTKPKTFHKIRSITFMSWKPKTLQNQQYCLRCPLRWSRNVYKIRNLFGVARHPAISHKEMLCAKRQHVRFCRGNSWRYHFYRSFPYKLTIHFGVPPFLETPKYTLSRAILRWAGVYVSTCMSCCSYNSHFNYMLTMS